MLEVSAVPIFSDNYVWVIHTGKGNEVCIVDPGDAGPVIDFLQENDLQLKCMFITHSHFDHISGIEALLEHADVPVYGPDCEAIPQVTNILSEGDELALGEATVKVIHLPGHLPELLAYVVSHQDTTQVFSGDILFSSGCGRIFNGSHAELKGSLDRIKSLAQDTLIYGAHEYTTSNLSFAREVEPENPQIASRTVAVNQLRENTKATLPALLSQELEVNPFLRCDQAEVVSAAKQRLGREPVDELEVFTALRLWKDQF